MPQERAPQDQDKYVVRFPDGMRDALKVEAARNNRSLNAEIVARLQQTLTEDANVNPSRDDYDLLRELLDGIRSGGIRMEPIKTSPD